MLNKNVVLFMALSVFTTALTGCMSTKGYQPSSGAETATLTYEINSSSFYAPKRFIDNGYIERVDIQLKPMFKSPNTVYMQLADGQEAHVFNEIESGKIFMVMYEHKVVKGLGNWPSLCTVIIPKLKLEANHNYLLKGRTVVDDKPSFWRILDKHEGTSCQIQIIDQDTQEVVVDSGLKKYK